VLNWDSYSFATNASYTGSAFTSIKNVALELGLQDEQIDFLGPEYWDKLCIKHKAVVAHRFDYRIPVAKARVAQAFEHQRYFRNTSANTHPRSRHLNSSFASRTTVHQSSLRFRFHRISQSSI